MPRINLNELVSDLVRAEGLKEKITVAQGSEFLGLIGHRWREYLKQERYKEYYDELRCITERSGLRSAHRSAEDGIGQGEGEDTPEE